jgi:PIN domain-containing protein
MQSTSTKACGASLQHDSPPESYTFFLDRCLGKQTVATRLRAAGHQVEIHADHFPQTENQREHSDCDWLRFAGEKQWVVLSKNKFIRRNQIEIAEILKWNVAAFISTASNITGDQIANSFLTAMPEITRLLKTLSPPYIATISKAGHVTTLMDREALERQAQR